MHQDAEPLHFIGTDALLSGFVVGSLFIVLGALGLLLANLYVFDQTRDPIAMAVRERPVSRRRRSASRS